METDNLIHLRGMTWNHHRGTAPIEATSEDFCRMNGNLTLDWDARPLKDFESQPLRELAENYDLIIIDHPHLGEAVGEGLLVDLSKLGRNDELEKLALESVGPSHASYQMNGGQYALAVDAATGVACYRPDRIQNIPRTWADVIELSNSGLVALPLKSPHALMAFFWMANARGFKVAESPEELMNPDQIEEVLEQFKYIVDRVPRRCFEMDPINLFDAMGSEDDAPSYCVHGYGYISYSTQGFKKHLLRFADVVNVAGLGVRGTVLGGTGIAVSALSEHQHPAIEYAFHIASADCQSGAWVSSGGQPGNRKAWENEGCNAVAGGFLKDTLKTLDGAWIRPRYDGYLAFQTEASQKISEYLLGECTLDFAASNLQELYRDSRR